MGDRVSHEAPYTVEVEDEAKLEETSGAPYSERTVNIVAYVSHKT
jgi:hypothetical protein